ncbi:MAG TPA: glutamate synthase large subunit, partial [Hyphomonadaceae bacterium]
MSATRPEEQFGEAWVREYERKRDTLIAANAYNPADEKDSCGVGLVVQIDGTPRREIVEMAIRALKAVWHRGAVDADGKTGDGAGIRVDVPQDFFRDAVRSQGHTISNDAQICVGQIFLPRTDLAAQEKARSIIETEVVRFGFYIYGWRQPPIDTSVIGQKANATRPEIEQILFTDRMGRDAPELERQLYICRRRIERRARESNLDLYLCSFSARALIYKGMFLAEDIDRFYLDLKDPRFVSAVAIYHQRYSTNTFPQWRLAQPFRMLAHNGEINTISGNIN